MQKYVDGILERLTVMLRDVDVAVRKSIHPTQPLDYRWLALILNAFGCLRGIQVLRSALKSLSGVACGAEEHFAEKYDAFAPGVRQLMTSLKVILCPLLGPWLCPLPAPRHEIMDCGAGQGGHG